MGHHSFLVRGPGNGIGVDVKRIIDERIRRRIDGVDVEADVHAVVAANVGERGQTTSVSSTSSATAGTRSSKEQDPPSK